MPCWTVSACVPRGARGRGKGASSCLLCREGKTWAARLGVGVQPQNVIPRGPSFGDSCAHAGKWGRCCVSSVTSFAFTTADLILCVSASVRAKTLAPCGSGGREVQHQGTGRSPSWRRLSPRLAGGHTLATSSRGRQRKLAASSPS